MMDTNVREICQRLSLRQPQKESLEILANLTQKMSLTKNSDLVKALGFIASEYPSVTDFERDFPSLCFNLATGVGKTRLMGAFITYLSLSKKIKNFFVLAPNLTIYSKLIEDFKPGTGKYVFQGIAEFAMRPPKIITGETYETGEGIRGADLLSHSEDVHINIFNVSKINSEVRGGKAPRIKRLSEYIGESYFDYLANLEDLVLLMDESHRYRASAGVKAINELKPILGLELTATPHIESGKTTTRFKNIIYAYPLYKAMIDGYVKEPAVATRENFKVESYTEDQLERLKLEDGICIHETVKTELKVYAANNDKPYVKPFMLVVAQDTTHAEDIMRLIQSDAFFEGRYKERTITVHSAQRGDEKDETVERLLKVEDPLEPTEIVIHVNMLKEGWDVTNLYTIVPLRAANSRTLVEQSIGRGLRLPYGRRTGVPAIDRLTIIAHDRFDQIIAEANDQKSIIRTGIVIGSDIDITPKKSLKIKANVTEMMTGNPAPAAAPYPVEMSVEKDQIFEENFGKVSKPVFNDKEQEIATATFEVFKEFESLPSSKKLQTEDVQQKIVRRIKAQIGPQQASLEGIMAEPDIENIVKRATQAYIDNIIDIPRIVLSPKYHQNYTFDKFTLKTSHLGHVKPVTQQILIHHLRTAEKTQIKSGRVSFQEGRLEDYLVSDLIDFDDISYDVHADILYDLAGQMIAYLRSYLASDVETLNILQYYGKDLAHEIHDQMQPYYKPGYTEYDVTVTRGFTHPKMVSVSYNTQEKIQHFRDNVAQRALIRGMLFQGFRKCLYPVQKFDSDTERQFAMLLETEQQVQKWFRPTREDFQIYYASNRIYEPDFVVETQTHKLLCEPKMAKEMMSEEVAGKTRAAVKWCAHATEHEAQHEGKPWKYILIPHTAIQQSATLSGLVTQFEVDINLDETRV